MKLFMLDFKYFFLLLVSVFVVNVIIGMFCVLFFIDLISFVVFNLFIIGIW